MSTKLAEYNFYRLNASGVVDTAKIVKLRDDETAIAHARAMFAGGPVEVWRAKRRLEIVLPSADRRIADRRAS